MPNSPEFKPEVPFSWDRDIAQKILGLEMAGFSQRAINALARKAYKNKDISDISFLDPDFLSRLPDESLSKIRGIGKKTVKHIREVLAAREET